MDSRSKTHSKLARFHHSIDYPHWVGELTKPKTSLELYRTTGPAKEAKWCQRNNYEWTFSRPARMFSIERLILETQEETDHTRKSKNEPKTPDSAVRSAFKL